MTSRDERSPAVEASPDRVAPWRREAVAGVTTFFTMAYIVVVNPAILSTEGTGMSFSGVLTATVLVAFGSTLLMGLYAKLPFALAPGMGLNAFVTYTLVLGQGIAWPVALGLVFWAGVAFLVISVTPVRESIARAIPVSIRAGAAAGIGLFLTFIGLKNAGIVVSHPATFVQLGPLGVKALLFAVGLAVASWLHHRKNPLAFLIAMALVTGLAAVTGQVQVPDTLLSSPDFDSMLWKLDVVGALEWALLPALVSLFFTDLFDSLSTFVGVAEATGLKDETGEPRNLRQGLIVDSLATLSAGLFGSSSGTTYIESAAGIEAGGRSGRTAVVCALCFVPCLFLAPVVAMVPPYATGAVLVLVGALMFRAVLQVDLSRLEDLVPVFLTAVLIPLTFSITQGLLWGFISHVSLYLLTGRRRELAPTMVLLAVASVGLLLLE
jgi:AGZA family xanthine/uracil permease-like MFS transporter